MARIPNGPPKPKTNPLAFTLLAQDGSKAIHDIVTPAQAKRAGEKMTRLS